MTRFQARERRHLQQSLRRCKAIGFHLGRASAARAEATAEQQQLHAETLAVTGADPALTQVLTVQLEAARARVQRLSGEVQRLHVALHDNEALLTGPAPDSLSQQLSEGYLPWPTVN